MTAPFPVGSRVVCYGYPWLGVGTVTRVDPAIYDSESGGTRLWLGRWGAVTPGLLGDWSGGDVQVAPLPSAAAVWFAPHPDQSDGSIVYTVALEIVQVRS